MAEKTKASLTSFFEGYRQFRAQYFRENRAMIEALMAKGQRPKAMMIACSDSRIDPSLKFGVNPGEMFIVRNVANLVPPYGPDNAHHGTSAALEFAVRDLQVEHIIVMGHAKCGGIQALMQQERRQDDYISAWMKIAAPARTFAMENAKDPAAAQRMCEHEAVKTSLANLMTFPWVAERVATGKLELHGWYFDLETASLFVCDAAGAFKQAE